MKTITIQVAGVSYDERQKLIKSMPGDARIVLQREDNLRDYPNAVSVRWENNGTLSLIGWIPDKKDGSVAASIKPNLDKWIIKRWWKVGSGLSVPVVDNGKPVLDKDGKPVLKYYNQGITLILEKEESTMENKQKGQVVLENEWLHYIDSAVTAATNLGKKAYKTSKPMITKGIKVVKENAPRILNFLKVELQKGMEAVKENAPKVKEFVKSEVSRVKSELSSSSSIPVSAAPKTEVKDTSQMTFTLDCDAENNIPKAEEFVTLNEKK